MLLHRVLASLFLIELEDLNVWGLLLHLFIKLCYLFLDCILLFGEDDKFAFIESVCDGSMLQMIFETFAIDVTLRCLLNDYRLV